MKPVDLHLVCRNLSGLNGQIQVGGPGVLLYHVPEPATTSDHDGMPRARDWFFGGLCCAY
uniref:GHMP kinase n=1 Tax=Mesocestoides corti TaxID=53468 RepID=A0A5K3FRA6_MESCO